MTRVLDANVFITAKNFYYAPDLVPRFWTWLDEQADSGHIASTDLVYEELRAGGDYLSEWVQDRRDSLFHIPSSSPVTAQHVARLGEWAARDGYREHVVAEFMDCADPFLVSVAAEHNLEVVTLETPAGLSRKKVKIPDACRQLNVPWISTFDMMRTLGARFE